MPLQVDLLKQTQAYNLPEQAQYEMFTAVSQILTSDVNDGASYRASRGDGEVVVLRDLKLVEGPVCGWHIEFGV